MGSRLARPVGVICSVSAFIMAVSGFSSVGDEINSLMGSSGLSEVGIDVMKILGTGYVFGVCADTLDGLGEGSISKGLDALCRVEITLITLPYIKDIVALGLSLIK
jgi:hypothetical protein